jgi:hypothetical protein
MRWGSLPGVGLMPCERFRTADVGRSVGDDCYCIPSPRFSLSPNSKISWKVQHFLNTYTNTAINWCILLLYSYWSITTLACMRTCTRATNTYARHCTWILPHSRISVHLAQNFVHKRVYFSLFNILLSTKNCFSLITRESRPIAFLHFSTCT